MDGAARVLPSTGRYPGRRGPQRAPGRRLLPAGPRWAAGRLRLEPGGHAGRHPQRAGSHAPGDPGAGDGPARRGAHRGQAHPRAAPAHLRGDGQGSRRGIRRARRGLGRLAADRGHRERRHPAARGDPARGADRPAWPHAPQPRLRWRPRGRQDLRHPIIRSAAAGAARRRHHGDRRVDAVRSRLGALRARDGDLGGRPLGHPPRVAGAAGDAGDRARGLDRRDGTDRAGHDAGRVHHGANGVRDRVRELPPARGRAADERPGE